MKITDEMLERVAALSGLALPAEKKDKAKKDLEEMLALSDRLSAFDTAEAAEETGPVLALGDLREDIVQNPDGKEALLKNAPDGREEGLTVPKWIS